MCTFKDCENKVQFFKDKKKQKKMQFFFKEKKRRKIWTVYKLLKRKYGNDAMELAKNGKLKVCLELFINISKLKQKKKKKQL